MSNTFKIFIAVFLAIIAANFFNTALFRFGYPSDTELAIQQSQQYIDNYSKINAERVQATIRNIEEERNSYLDNTMKQRYKASKQNRSVFYNNQADSNYMDNSKYAKQLEALEKEKRERKAALKARQRTQSKDKEAQRKRHENKMADLQHIRTENIKTCNHWTAEYKRNPIAQNEIYKKTSCDRAYGR